MKLARGTPAGRLARVGPGTAGRGLLDRESVAAILVFLALAALPALISGYPIYILPQYMLYGMLALSLRAALGPGRHRELRPGRVLRARRLHDGARDAPDRAARQRRLSGPARQHPPGRCARRDHRLLPVQRGRARRLFRDRDARALDHRRAARGQPVADHRRLERHVHRPHVAHVRSSGRILPVRRRPDLRARAGRGRGGLRAAQGPERGPLRQAPGGRPRERGPASGARRAHAALQDRRVRALRVPSPAWRAPSMARTPRSSPPRSPASSSRPRSSSGSRSAAAILCSARCWAAFSWPRSRTT